MWGLITILSLMKNFKSVISFLSILLIENSILLPFFRNSLFLIKSIVKFSLGLDPQDINISEKIIIVFENLIIKLIIQI